MRVPEIEEVREYFKDAWEVEDMYGDRGVVLIDKIERDTEDNFLSYIQGDPRYESDLKIDHLVLWNEDAGYAKIISYKDKTYQITERQIKEVEKGELNMRELFPEVFKPVLEVGKWYKHGECLYCVTEINIYGEYKAYGYDYEGNWSDAQKFGNIENEIIEEAKQATDSEILEALMNEAENRGYKVGVTCLFGDFKDKRTIESELFSFKPSGIWKNSLFMGEDCIFRNGNWAEIVKQEPVELSLQEIADKFEIDVELLKIKK